MYKIQAWRYKSDNTKARNFYWKSDENSLFSYKMATKYFILSKKGNYQ